MFFSHRSVQNFSRESLSLLDEPLIAHLLIPKSIPIQVQDLSILRNCGEMWSILEKITIRISAYVVELIVLFEVLNW